MDAVGSTPTARDSAKVVDQVQLLARTLFNSDAGARRQGDCLHSSFQWVRLRAPIGMDAGLVVRLCVDATTSVRRLTNNPNIGS